MTTMTGLVAHVDDGFLVLSTKNVRLSRLVLLDDQAADTSPLLPRRCASYPPTLQVRPSC